MGVYTDILANAQSIDLGVDDGRVSIDKMLVRSLQGLEALQGDIDYPSGTGVTDEVQSIAIYSGTVSGGDFTLEFVLANGETFTTAAIAHDANAATIETAIDTAADGVVTGFTAGDIAVTGGPLTTTPVVFTYSGASVTGANHGEVVIDGTGLTGGGTAGDESTTTEGQTARPAWAILKACSAIAGTIPAQGEAATAITIGSNRQTNPNLPSQDVLRALAREAAIEDDLASVETEILRVLGLS
jgi:hypothetical protein